MPVWPDPLPLDTIVPRMRLGAVRAVFNLAKSSGADVGGVTIGNGESPRVLVYVDPCPKLEVEAILRALLPEFEVSTLRNSNQIKPKGARRRANQYRTRTAANPSGD